MNQTKYNNLPSEPKNKSSSDLTIQAFDTYYSKPLEISVDILNSMSGFFQSKGFEQVASENIAMVIIKQAKKDGYNPMQILDTLKGFDNVEISALVSEILNYNRFKTSFLGYTQSFVINDEVLRNIQA
jgi:hypothetical protein